MARKFVFTLYDFDLQISPGVWCFVVDKKVRVRAAQGATGANGDSFLFPRS